MMDWLSRKLGRVTSSGDFLPEIDGLRFLAIVPVVVYHLTVYFLISRQVYTDHWGHDFGRVLSVVGTFWIGVQFFFVISGFILARPFARYWLGYTDTKPSLAKYYLRRVTRIEPPYIVCLIATFFILRKATWPSFLASLFYVHVPFFGEPSRVNLAFWSLEVEVGFYLVAPWLAQIFRVRPAWLRRSILLIGVAAWSWMSNYWMEPKVPVIKSTLPGELQYFLAGILLADLHVSGFLDATGSVLWDVLAICGIALVPVIVSRFYYQAIWTIPLVIMVIYAGAFRGRFVHGFFRWKPLTLIGGMCYSIYLWHIPIIHYLGPGVSFVLLNGLTLKQALPLLWLSLVPVILAISALLFYWIEKPFMTGRR